MLYFDGQAWLLWFFKTEIAWLWTFVLKLKYAHMPNFFEHCPCGLLTYPACRAHTIKTSEESYESCSDVKSIIQL
jgi:hypothetical protein